MAPRDHARYDTRGYPIVGVREGYGAWTPTYEQTVLDEMDIRLLERLGTVEWSAAGAVVDLACGTGRIGAWLASRTEGKIDGVDLTPEMLGRARERSIYRTLVDADVAATGLPGGSYDLCIQSLADEHLSDLAPLYAEAARLTRVGGHFVLVGFHPQFLMGGVPTHFDRASGGPVTIRSYVHLLSEHVGAAHAHGWRLREMEEGLVDDDWLRAKPKWERYAGTPVSFAFVWRRE